MTEIKYDHKVLCDSCGIDHEIVAVTYLENDMQKDGYLCRDCFERSE